MTKESMAFGQCQQLSKPSTAGVTYLLCICVYFKTRTQSFIFPYELLHNKLYGSLISIATTSVPQVAN